MSFEYILIYKMNRLKKVLLIVTLLIFAVQFAKAQHVFRGKVIDSITRQPVEYASISVNGKSTGTSRTGNFQLSLSADTATLTISYIGYQTKMIAIKSSPEQHVITLTHGHIDLREVVISPH